MCVFFCVGVDGGEGGGVVVDDDDSRGCYESIDFEQR